MARRSGTRSREALRLERTDAHESSQSHRSSTLAMAGTSRSLQRQEADVRPSEGIGEGPLSAAVMMRDAIDKERSSAALYNGSGRPY